MKEYRNVTYTSIDMMSVGLSEQSHLDWDVFQIWRVETASGHHFEVLLIKRGR